MKSSFIRLSTIFALILFSMVNIFAGGTITGTVKYEGKVPPMKALKMASDPICDGKHQNAPARSEWLIVGKSGELKNAFVWIKKGAAGNKAAPKEHAVLDQNGCIYSPHVLGVQVGQVVDILNTDGTLHNVHAMPKLNSEFNIAMPKFKKKKEVTFTKQETMFPIKCDVHPWMKCYVAVVNHPFFDVTGEDGNFKISGLPAGKYTLEVWHEKLGTKSVSVTVADGATKTVDFTLTKPKKKKK
jgi:plastocyanin